MITLRRFCETTLKTVKSSRIVYKNMLNNVLNIVVRNHDTDTLIYRS